MSDIYDNLTKEQLIGLQKQIRWERDVAIEQLYEIGKEFGEKMDDVHKVVFCKDCRHKCVKGKTTRYHYCEIWKSAVDETDFCSRGEKR